MDLDLGWPRALLHCCDGAFQEHDTTVEEWRRSNMFKTEKSQDLVHTLKDYTWIRSTRT